MAARKRKKTKRVTIDQLKAYIEGAIEFNSDDWSPNKDQWDSIVEMIMNIKEEPKEVVVEQQTVNQQARQQQQPQEYRSSLMESVEDHSERQATGPRPPKIDMRRIKAQHTSTGVPQPEIEKMGDVPVSSSGKMYKTPSMDTSNGDYESSFE